MVNMSHAKCDVVCGENVFTCSFTWHKKLSKDMLEHTLTALGINLTRPTDKCSN